MIINIFNNWKNFLLKEENNDQFLTKEIVSKLVSDYAIKPSELKFKFGDIKQYINLAPKDFKKGGAANATGFYVMKDDPSHPLYKTFVINTSATGRNLIEQFITTLHEIQHFNQHVTWLHSDLAGKVSFIKNLANKYGVNTFPDEINFLESNTPISEMDEEDKTYFENYPIQEGLFRWWEKKLGYNNAPHEKDAKEFSFSNTQKSITKFLSPKEIIKIINKCGLNSEYRNFVRGKK